MNKIFSFILAFALAGSSALHPSSAHAGGVYIDAGHSPKSPGTVSCSGKPEFSYNALLAKSVAGYLRDKNIQVTLIRKGNEEKSLLERARSSDGGTLLLSLHHDSVQPRYLSQQSSKYAYCSGKAKGFSIFISRKNPDFEKSLQYATLLGAALVKRGLIPTLHHAEPIAGENRELLVPDKGVYVFDDLVILKKSNVPALLLEAAVIVNPEDDSLASSDKFRTVIAESVYEMLKASQ